MKKLLLFCILCLFPLQMLTAKILEEDSITGQNEVEIGSEHTYVYDAIFKDIGKTKESTFGYVTVMVEVFYDEEVFALLDVEARHFEQKYIYEKDENGYITGGHIIIISTLKEGTAIDYCANNNLYCGAYLPIMRFYIKDTTKETGTIKIGKVKALAVDLKDKNPENVTEEDFVILETDSKAIREIKIKQKKVETPTPKPSISSPEQNAYDYNKYLESLKKPLILPKEEKPSTNIQTTKPTNNTQTETKKSSNNYLNSLEIQNYPIDFNKETKEYEIIVGKNINKIIIKVNTEDEKAFYKITGDDDLNANNNRVSIEVTAEDRTKTTYTINVKHKEEEEVITENKIEKTKSKITSDKKILKLFGIIGGVLALIILIFIITGIIRKRKINKMFEEL